MQYGVIDSFVCPETGTTFSCVISRNNHKAILWYEGMQLLTSGDVLTKEKDRLLVNGRRAELTLHKISTFNAGLWKSLQKRSQCPGNKTYHPALCFYRARCLFECCPYGICGVRLSPLSYREAEPE
ncbi:hypothetical protein J0B02_00080 [Enterobacteriaceae bacterium YMB-R22]|jgi:hypothetical protein|uniref:hypothetical protein n=1 Tax=Tenebrionicola larvae TaxID=2815733 RepID=UPI0020110F5C|nr:hypothetical protein [Tenebrionicola larvae]MBV4411256.1 hypothetical protein [Tenebrionicola larvae]